jgi:hypothetical protein
VSSKAELGKLITENSTGKATKIVFILILTSVEQNKILHFVRCRVFSEKYLSRQKFNRNFRELQKIFLFFFRFWCISLSVENISLFF